MEVPDPGFEGFAAMVQGGSVPSAAPRRPAFGTPTPPVQPRDPLVPKLRQALVAELARRKKLEGMVADLQAENGGLKTEVENLRTTLAQARASAQAVWRAKGGAGEPPPAIADEQPTTMEGEVIDPFSMDTDDELGG